MLLLIAFLHGKIKGLDSAVTAIIHQVVVIIIEVITECYLRVIAK